MKIIKIDAKYTEGINAAAFVVNPLPNLEILKRINIKYFNIRFNSKNQLLYVSSIEDEGGFVRAISDEIIKEINEAYIKAAQALKDEKAKESALHKQKVNELAGLTKLPIREEAEILDLDDLPESV